MLQLVSQHGAEADRHLFRCLFSHVDFSSDGKSAGKDIHQVEQIYQRCSIVISLWLYLGSQSIKLTVQNNYWY